MPSMTSARIWIMTSAHSMSMQELSSARKPQLPVSTDGQFCHRMREYNRLDEEAPERGTESLLRSTIVVGVMLCDIPAMCK